MKRFTRMLSITVAVIMCVSLLYGCRSSGINTENKSAPQQAEQVVKQAEGGNGIVKAKPELKGKVRIGYRGLNELTGPDPITGRTIYGADELQKWFKKDYPNLEFEIIVFPGSADHYTKTKALMEARQIDVLITSSTAQVYQEGYSLDMTPFIEKDKEYNLDLHASQRLATYYREINPKFPEDPSKSIANCLPYDGGAEIMFYDAQIFKDWGVEPITDNPTLDEIYEKAKKMTGKNPRTGQQNYGLFFPTGGKPATWNLAAVVNALGGDVGDYMPDEWDIKIKVDSPEWIKGLEWIKSIQPFTPVGAETGQGLEKWGTKDNNIAMKFDTATTFVFQYESMKLEGQYEPAARPGNKNREHSRLGGMRVQIMKEALNKDLAWEIVKWFSVGNGQRFLMSTQIGWPTSIKALGSDVKMTDEEKKALEIGSRITKKTPVDSLSLHPIMIDTIESVTLKNVSPKDALQKAEQRRIDSYNKLKQAAKK